MLDLLEPSEDESLEFLVPVLVDEAAAPPEEGFHSLWTALDQQFGTEGQRVAPVVPLRHRFVRIVTAVAAAVVVLAVGLGLYGWQRGSSRSPASTKLDFATATLRSDLESGNSPTRIEKDVAELAQAMANVPSASGHTTTTSDQLLASACQWLEGSTLPSTTLPPACRTGGASGGPSNWTSGEGGNDSSNSGGSVAHPNRGSIDPTQQSSEGPGTRPDSMGSEYEAPSAVGPSGETTVPSDGHQSSPDWRGASAPTTPQTQPESPLGETAPSSGSASDDTTQQGPNTFVPSSRSDTSPNAGSSGVDPSSECPDAACTGNAFTQQVQSGSPRFQR